MRAFAGPGEIMTRGRIIRWWELRRLLYNGVLLVVGAAAIVGMEWLLSKVIPSGQDALEPTALALGVVAYAILANMYYTLGWVVELYDRRKDPLAARRRGLWMFRVGTIFSCVLTSLPFWFACVYWLTHQAQSQ